MSDTRHINFQLVAMNEINDHVEEMRIFNATHMNTEWAHDSAIGNTPLREVNQKTFLNNFPNNKLNYFGIFTFRNTAIASTIICSTIGIGYLIKK